MNSQKEILEKNSQILNELSNKSVFNIDKVMEQLEHNHLQIEQALILSTEKISSKLRVDIHALKDNGEAKLKTDSEAYHPLIKREQEEKKEHVGVDLVGKWMNNNFEHFLRDSTLVQTVEDKSKVYG